MKSRLFSGMGLFSATRRAAMLPVLLFLLGAVLPVRAQVDPNFQIYLLIGQSNMEGFGGAEAQDRVTNPRIKVLAYTNCSNPGRQYNKWYLAAAPLHGCNAGVGPGDYFAKAMADSFPKATIGLVPTAIAGVDIDFFRKGVVSRRRNEFSIPPDNQRTGAYDMVIEKAKEAQKVGVIRGILFHQGESDAGDEAWVGKVKGMVNDLRKDLNLGEAAPFLAGELLYKEMVAKACCSNHNSIIAKLPANIPNAAVISAKDLAGNGGSDVAHFNLSAQREFGRRYAAKMAPLVRPFVATGVLPASAASGGPGIEVRQGGVLPGLTASCTSKCSGFTLFGLDGRQVASSTGASWNLPEQSLRRGVYFLRADGVAGGKRPLTLLLGR